MEWNAEHIQAALTGTQQGQAADTSPTPGRGHNAYEQPLRKVAGKMHQVSRTFPGGPAQVILAPRDSPSPSLCLQEAQVQVTRKEEVPQQVAQR